MTVLAPDRHDPPSARRAAPDDRGGPERGRRAQAASAYGALAVVLAWNLWRWRAQLTAVPYLDDSSVHAQMVRFATARFDAGHSPLTGWFPFLGLGSPQFLHYQSLGAMVSGALGTLTGADAAFRWTLYLLLALWPLPIYAAARLFGSGRGAAALAAAASPLLMSAVGVGFEPKAYVWFGYGVWAQLWASWALPLAWACTWRAMSSRRAVAPAAALVALTACLHFETGYLAFVPVVLFPFLAPGGRADARRRAGRALAVGAGGVLLSSWATVPLIVQGRWAATNEILAGGPLVNGYGAKQVLSWLFTGHLFDAGRLPVVTVLGGAGVVASVLGWRRAPRGRALLALLVMSLVLSFGRTTFGPLTDVLPGSGDIFMRRFMMGAQLAGILLAGEGGAALWRLGRVLAGRWTARAGRRAPTARALAAAALAGALAVVFLAPAWTQIDRFAGFNARAIAAQHAADAGPARQLDTLLGYVRLHGGGRVYAGMPSNWGSGFRVGRVPVFKYLEAQDIDEVGYTLRTASLMTDPEFFFDEDDPGDYALFAVRYMILPVAMAPPVPATAVAAAGPYRLWALPGRGYVRVVTTVGVLNANRSTVGVMSEPYLHSGLPGAGRYLAVAYAGAPPAPLTATTLSQAEAVAGRVRGEHDDLADGTVTATVTASRRAVAVLSASFDPGWTVQVDGRPARTEMLAPALVGVALTPGAHTVVFRYGGFGLYPVLFAVVALTALALAWTGRRTGRARAPETAPS
ncbi:MAG TPA: YfhO family protein [Acidimicrobiales bacterium]|nr:YfhO family protein [Acidimicrobiales bacterium]